MLASPLVLFAAALVLRLAYIWLLVEPNTVPGNWMSVAGDYIFFESTGWSIAEGRGYATEMGPTAFMPPGYSMFIGAVYATAGRSVTAVRIVQSVLMALIAPLVWLYARRLASKTAALAAGAIAVVHPDLIYPVGRLQKENVYIPVLLLLVLALSALASRSAHPAREKRRPLLLALGVLASGSLLSASALLRSDFLLAIPAIFLWFAVYGRARRRCTIALALVTAIPLFAWGLRNHRVFDKWIFTATGAGVTLHHSVARIAEAQGIEPPAPVPSRPGSLQREYWIDRDYLREARSWIVSHPGACAKAVPQRLWAFWGFIPSGAVFENGAWWARLVGLAAYGALFPLWLVGFALFLRQKRPVGLFLALAIPLSLIGLTFIPSARIRSPLVPFLLVFAGHAIATIWDRLRRRRAAPA